MSDKESTSPTSRVSSPTSRRPLSSRPPPSSNEPPRRSHPSSHHRGRPDPLYDRPLRNPEIPSTTTTTTTTTPTTTDAYPHPRETTTGSTTVPEKTPLPDARNPGNPFPPPSRGPTSFRRATSRPGRYSPSYRSYGSPTHNSTGMYNTRNTPPWERATEPGLPSQETPETRAGGRYPLRGGPGPGPRYPQPSHERPGYPERHSAYYERAGTQATPQETRPTPYAFRQERSSGSSHTTSPVRHKEGGFKKSEGGGSSVQRGRDRGTEPRAVERQESNTGGAPEKHPAGGLKCPATPRPPSVPEAPLPRVSPGLLPSPPTLKIEPVHGPSKTKTAWTPPLWQNVETFLQQHPSSLLTGAVMGIDVRYWLRRLEPTLPPMFSFQRGIQKVQDPLVAITGGVPLTLESVLREEIAKFDRLGMHMLFVFGGITSEDGIRACDLAIGQQRKVYQDKIWARVANGTYAVSDKVKVERDAWETGVLDTIAVPQLENDEVLSEVQGILWRASQEPGRTNHIHVLHAPQGASSQLAFFKERQAIQCVYGPPMLLWLKTPKIERVVLEIDGDSFYGLENTSEKPLSVPEQLAGYYPWEHSVTPSHEEHSSEFVLNAEGMLEKLNPAEESTKVFADVQDDLLLHHSLGLLSTAEFKSSLNRTLVDVPPAVDSHECRNALREVLRVRAHVVSRVLPKFERDRPTTGKGAKLKWYRWFQSDKEPELISRPPCPELGDWILDKSLFSPLKSPEECPLSTPSMVQVLRTPREPRPHDFMYTQPAEIYASLCLKLFDFLGYFVHSTLPGITRSAHPHERTSCNLYGRILASVPDPFAPSTVLFIELARCRAMTAVPLQHPNLPQTEGSREVLTHPPFRTGQGAGESPGGTAPRSTPGGTAAERLVQSALPKTTASFAELDIQNRSALLLARLFSLSPVRVSKGGRGTTTMTTTAATKTTKEGAGGRPQVLSMDLAAFWSMARAVRGSLRSIVGSVAAADHSLLDVENEHLGELLCRLPFQDTPPPVMGAVLEYVLGMGKEFRGYGLSRSEERLAHLVEKFPFVENMKEALEVGCAWVRQAVHMIEMLQEAQRTEPPTVSEAYRALYEVSHNVLSILDHIQTNLGLERRAELEKVWEGNP